MVEEKKYGLIHEDLKWLRKSVNKRFKRFNRYDGRVQLISRRSKKIKRRLNKWWFRKFLNQTAYKCAWEGVKSVKSKHTKGSSSTCPICRSKLNRYLNGQVECGRCGFIGNRHVVACLNLLRWEAVVQPQPLLKCSREASPNKAF
jgi:transposase